MIDNQHLLKQLNLNIQEQKNQQIYECAQSLLKSFPEDEDFIACLVLAACRMGKLKEVAPYFQKQPTKKTNLQQLYPYYLYLNGKYKEAIQYIQSYHPKNEILQTLKAQALFKSYQYADSSNIFESKMNSVKEIQQKQMYFVNLLATGIHNSAGLNNKKQFAIKSLTQLNTKEINYNLALFFCECKEYEKASPHLDKFRKQLSKEQDSSDITTADLLKNYIIFQEEDQVSPLWKKQYDEMVAEEPNTKKIIYFNNLILSGTLSEHFNDALKHSEEFRNQQFKASSYQLEAVSFNRINLLAKKGRYAEAQKQLKFFEENSQFYCTNNFEFIKTKYFIMKKLKSPQLIDFIKKIKQTDQILSFCLYVDYCLEENKEKALLTELSEGNFKSAQIKTYLFSLFLKNKDWFDQSETYLQKLINQTKDVQILQILLKIYKSKGNTDKEKILLTKITRLNPKDSVNRAKLAKIYLDSGEIEAAEGLLQMIGEPQEIEDINYLQSIEKNIHISTKKEETFTKSDKEETETGKKKIKKKRKPRLPKNMEKFIEGYKPNPEAWLPKWQRKGYKKKRGKGNKTQGLANVGSQQKSKFISTSTGNKEVSKAETKKRR